MTATAEQLKKRAAEEAVELIRSGMIVGLGTGSTAAHAVSAIARKLESGELTDLLGIPTSAQTEEQARRLEVPLTTLEDHPEVDLTIDGADQVDPAGNLIKGGGGSLVREKIIDHHSQTLIIIIDRSKIVTRLGKVPLPVEVIPFGWQVTAQSLGKLGCLPTLRKNGSEIFVSDNGNYILDCQFQKIRRLEFLERQIDIIPGVVESGLFLGMAGEVIIGDD